MTNNCPACNKAVDPLRSRFVAVRGGKVVAFCSAECAQTQGADRPAASHAGSPATGVPTAIPTPAKGVPVQPPGGSVPTRTRTPASGVPAGPPIPVTPAPGVPISLESGPVIEILHEPASGVVTSARDERSESRGVGAPTAVPAGRGSSPVGSTERSESRGTGTAVPAGLAPLGSTERTEPRAKHPDEISLAEFWTADKGSGTVRTVTDAGSAPVKLSSSGRDDTTLSKWAADNTDELRAIGRADSDADADDAVPRRAGRLRLAILIVILLGVGGLLVYQYLVKNGLAATTRQAPPRAEPAAAATPPAPAPTPTAAPPAPGAMPGAELTVARAMVEPAKLADPATIDVPAAVGRARSVLEADLTATSPRLQRLAAAALARTQHPAARDLLAAHMMQTSAGDLGDIARLDLAYSLARGGDKRGGDSLAAALRSPRAEVRDEAARLLALLGDRRAVAHLTDVLAVTQRRLGAAEHLAHLDDANAIKILEQIRADATSSTNDKARAAIALATAGHRDVAPALRAMLSDPHFNAFAAAALAELRDRAAQPVLVHQLESPALVVRAARALRRLDPALDPRPVLPHLLEVLRAGRDTDQVQAAEAILLLAGPETLSTFD